MRARFSTDSLIKKYIDLIRELGHFPLEGDLRVKRHRDNTFPSHGSFNSLGSKTQRAKKVFAYCQEHGDYVDIIPFCLEVLSKTPHDPGVSTSESSNVGYVYIVKHGSRAEYKIGKTFNPVRREGEIALQLPEKVRPIHYIKTDDPSGVEKYWHTRFAEKRKEGEWFALTAIDVRAFRRWKRIY